MANRKRKNTKNENHDFDEKLLQKAADMSEKDLAAFVKAARAEATLGEMMDVLRREYSWRTYR